MCLLVSMDVIGSMICGESTLSHWSVQCGSKSHRSYSITASHVSFAHRMGIFRLPAATVHVLWLANTCLCFQDKVELKPPTRQSDRNHTADASNRPCVLGCFRSHLIQTPGQKSLLVIWCSSSSCVVADDHCRSKEGAHRLMHATVTRLCISTTSSMCLEV